MSNEIEPSQAPSAPTPKPGLMRIAPYIGGKSKPAGGANRVIKLSSNENPHGPSPKAREAFAEAGASLGLYPDGGATALREAIAEVHGLDPARIVCGAGSDELISLLCVGYAGPGDKVLHSAHGFLMYSISALASGAEPVAVPEKNLAADIDGLIAAADDSTTMLFLANPNNPTGTMIPGSEIRRLREGLPAHVLLVIDSAYAEYVDDPEYESGARLVSERDDVVMTRTFSKIYGLAALRLGWCYAPQAVCEVLHRLRGPFNTNAPALAAGAAAMRDAEYLRFIAEDNAAQRARMAEALAAQGFGVTPSHGNFLLVECGSGGCPSAAKVDEYLQSRGVLIRRMEGYGLPDHLRFSVGTADENTALLAALSEMPR